jgi:class 3 adenylate cyclase/tetratricopeptide (TPR) repeat protein
MLCPRCHAENREGRRFCSKCAAPLAVVCGSCGFTNDPGDEFCGGCAQSLRADTKMPPKFQSPDSYTPKHLAEKILTSKAALEGERKQVTVLFADLKGSMELLADRDPEEARRLLDPVIEHMMEGVHRYEGTVNQVMGDGIMALFGAPLAHEDHAVRACYAALRMQESVKRYAEGVRKVEGIPIRIRVGLNSGEVVVRSIGSDLRMDYTAVGQTTHLAARMEQMAEPGSVLMTGDSLGLAEGYIQAKSLGPLPVKGLSAPVEVYEVVGVEAVRSRLHVTAARGLTQFVGRDPEMEQLRLVQARARDGQGQVIAVVGEPGVGKSRLYWEFTHSHRTDGWLVLESRSVSYGKATSYLPVIDLLKSYFLIEAQDEPRRMREKVTGKLLSLDETLRPALPALLALLDLPAEDKAWQALDPALRRQRTLDAVKRLLLRESRAQPLVVIFEDLHWIDSETQAFLDGLVESLPTAQLLFLVNYRPEYQHGWGSKTFYHQLQIAPLPSESAGALLQGLLGGDTSLESLKSLLIPRTAGNPFFLEECVRTLVETRALVGDRGAYRLAREVSGLQVPTTVQAVLAARIDRLASEDKRLLQAAAVIGKDVPFQILQAIGDIPEHELRGSLTTLQAAEFLYEAQLFPDLEYTFKHALTQEVAYGSVLHERRKALHTRIVDAIERAHAGRLEEQVERLARHAQEAELWDKAVRYGRLAGVRAESRSVFREAARHYEDALAVLTRLPEDRTRIEEAIDLRLKLRGPLWQMARYDELLANLRDAERAARQIGDAARAGRIAMYMFNLFWITGRHEDWQRLLPIVHAAIEASDDPSLRAYAAIQLGQTATTTGHVVPARNVLESCLEIADREVASGSNLGGEPRVQLRALLAFTYAYLGQFQAGIVRGVQGIEIADSIGIPFTQAYIRCYFAFLYVWKGDLAAVLPLSYRAMELGEAYGLGPILPAAMTAHGWALCGAGRIGEGLSLVEKGIKLAESRSLMHYHTTWMALLCESVLLSGDLERAELTALQVLDLARTRREPGNEAWAHCLLGDGRCASHADAEPAERSYRDALLSAEALRLRPLIARCHFGLGKLYRRTGNRQQAHEHLTTATTMYREMEMKYWLEQAEAEMGA